MQGEPIAGGFSKLFPAVVASLSTADLAQLKIEL
jgi:hypothetical protein